MSNIWPTPPNSLEAPEGFSYRMMAPSQNYRRFSTPNRVILKAKDQPADSQPPNNSKRTDFHYLVSQFFQREVTSFRQKDQARFSPFIGSDGQQRSSSSTIWGTGRVPSGADGGTSGRNSVRSDTDCVRASVGGGLSATDRATNCGEEAA